MNLLTLHSNTSLHCYWLMLAMNAIECYWSLTECVRCCCELQRSDVKTNEMSATASTTLHHHHRVNTATDL